MTAEKENRQEHKMPEEPLDVVPGGELPVEDLTGEGETLEERPEETSSPEGPPPETPQEVYLTQVVTHKDQGPLVDQPEDSPVDIFEVEADADEEDFPLSDEEVEDYFEVGVRSEEVTEEMEQFTDDVEVIEDFEERQSIGAGGAELEERLHQQTGLSPDISADDVDARWDQADQSGEEAVGGTVPTPDQDQVEEIGEALGITYEEDEPLRTADKLEDRDRNRWELNPASAEDFEEQVDELAADEVEAELDDRHKKTIYELEQEDQEEK